ncbi:putative dual specificity tyrosine-phosphorylation-regulated kinase 3 homolog isoform X2 [Drosophila hydei]|uniref:dual-specificity kinase n=1 Tax=Drosophila hydei TaxID=7224 RepID=A0A6J1LLI2_DROHY|nr:putative dual specificity tyrosine-phosphorylation-regulated kinase 3 homolog isoform X2 [Drosophila hydei]
MWEQSNCQNNLSATKRSKSLEESTFQSKDRSSLKNVFSFNILSGLCGRQINRDTESEEIKNYLKIRPGSSNNKDVANSTKRFSTDVHLKYARKSQILGRSNVADASNYLNYRNPQSEFGPVHRRCETPTLTECTIDQNYKNLSIYFNNEKEQLENRTHKLTKTSFSDDREYARRRRNPPVTRTAKSVKNQNHIQASSIKKCIWPRNERNICWPSPLENNLFCLTTPSVLIDAVARHKSSLEIDTAGLLDERNGDSERNFEIQNLFPSDTKPDSYESELNLESDEDVDHNSESCTHLQSNVSNKARRQLTRQASIQSQLSSIDDSSPHSERYGTAFETLEDITAHDFENILSQEYQSNSNLLPASSVRLVMSLSSYRSQQAQQPLNNFTNSQQNLGRLSQLPTPPTKAPYSTLQLGSSLNNVDENKSQKFLSNSEIVTEETAIIGTANNNQSVTRLNNNMVGSQQQTKHNSQLAATNAIRDASTFTSNLEAASIDIQIEKSVSPAMLKISMSQNQQTACGIDGSGSGQMNPNSLSLHSCTVVPFNFNSSYGSAVILQERKQQHAKQLPIPHEISTYIGDSSTQDASGVSKSIQASSLPNSIVRPKLEASPILPRKELSLNAAAVDSLALVSQHQKSVIPSANEHYTFHEQIIMSGQQKSALQDKPKALVVSPQQVMILYMHKLTPYERTEILAYPQIYFIGANAKKRPGIYGPNNSDYDNEQGAYIHIPHDHVAYRYEMLKIIGKGSFGQVIKAYDHKTHEHVALKIVRNEKRFHRQAQEEIRILHHLRRHDKYNTMNIIHMYDYFAFRNHTCITFELLSINLYELIKKNGFKGFSLQLVRKFAHSLLQCLDALYKNEIIHCDMKPENVLLKQQGRSGIKVIDFGSSCFESQRVYTYIQSRFYRAPEVILGAKYGRAIDMWSLGCILAELLSGHALFPGENESDQLACIIEVLGMPSKTLLVNSKRAKTFFSPKGYPRYCTVRTMPDGMVVLVGGQSRRGKPRGPPCSKSLSKALDGCKDPLFLNFIRGCLEWDTEKRLTPSEALKHPWLRRRLPRPPSSTSGGAGDGSSSAGGGNTGGGGGRGSISGDQSPVTGIKTSCGNETVSTGGSAASERENSNCSGRVNHVGFGIPDLKYGSNHLAVATSSPVSNASLPVDLLADIISKTSVKSSTLDKSPLDDSLDSRGYPSSFLNHTSVNGSECLSTINSLIGATKSLTRLSEATTISTPTLTADSTLTTINFDMDCYKAYNANTIDKATNNRPSNANLLPHAQMIKAPSKDI